MLETGSELLVVSVAHDVAAGDLLGLPWRWKTAGGMSSSIERTAPR
jgi:hypothetical protein